MGYHDDPVGYEQRLRAKLKPNIIRGTLAFAGLYQITHEMIKHAVLDKVREFFCLDLNLDGTWSMAPDEQEQYRLRVLSLAPNKFRASLLWLVNNGAITQVQADRLEVIRDHRDDLVHELVKYVIDPDENPDVDLLVDALNTLKDLHRFWIDIELSTGGFFLPDGSDVGDVDAEEVMPLSLMILQQCLDAYLEDTTSRTPQAEGQEPHTKGDGVESP
ncbi:hypothetical protein [Mycobacterium sp. DBP42]|uniref:hypothetical protein n=1 Tax=Mycobacterium sp. DBP42 TaxID=2545267 RepID=UPI00110D1D78|nr:hypothetical protein [Mycobacterium sp. DBP42]TMS53653.1 hypothetical protein E0T84_10000 [Mycobacterium sp. DBP42]